MKSLRQNKNVRMFVFTTLNALIVCLIAILGDVTNPNLLAIAPFLVALLNLLTKWLNTKFLGDIGVAKPTV